MQLEAVPARLNHPRRPRDELLAVLCHFVGVQEKGAAHPVALEHVHHQFDAIGLLVSRYETEYVPRGVTMAFGFDVNRNQECGFHFSRHHSFRQAQPAGTEAVTSLHGVGERQTVVPCHSRA